MMHNEFLKITGYGESYFTYEDYNNYIEPAYMSQYIGKEEFCQNFRKHFEELVQKPVEMLIQAKTVEALEMYINGEESIVNDVKAIENELKSAFLKTYCKKLARGEF